MIKDIEDKLAHVFVVAVGCAPAGPWRIIVTTDPRTPLKQAKFWSRLPVEVGALLRLEAKPWAEKTRSGAAAFLQIADDDEAWVLGSSEEMQRAFAAAAQAAGAKHWDVHQHKQRVEAMIAKELAL